MVTLEQVRQLETKIGKAIDYVSRVNDENIRLRGELDGSERRAADLEDTVRRFQEEQGRIEEGLLAAMKRLDQFEDIVSDSLSEVQAVVAAAVPAAAAVPPRMIDPVKTASPAPQANPFDEEPFVEGTVGRESSYEPSGEAASDEKEPPLQAEEPGELDIF
jgi:hypothetical protein